MNEHEPERGNVLERRLKQMEAEFESEVAFLEELALDLEQGQPSALLQRRVEKHVELLRRARGRE
jgi:hypothetical protein